MEKQKEYKIESNIPLPGEKNKKKREYSSLTHIYKEMKSGQSVVVPKGKAASAWWVAKSRGMKCITKRVTKRRVRVWLVAAYAAPSPRSARAAVTPRPSSS